MNRPTLIGIAGGTGSGKTTVARKVAAGLPAGTVILLEHDSYYRDLADLEADARTEVNFDHPDSLDNDLLLEQLDLLMAGEPVEVPQYDFSTHTREPSGRFVRPAPVIILEGILVFVDPRLRERMHVKLFVDTDSDLRVFRRIRRDLEQRGRSFESIRDQYYATVRPMHLEFVAPSKRWADLIIPEGGDNQVALDLLIARLRTLAV
jgi:uridine kinase